MIRRMEWLLAPVLAGLLASCGGATENERGAPKANRPAGWLEPVRTCSRECVTSYAAEPTALFCIDSCDSAVDLEFATDAEVTEMIGCTKACVVTGQGNPPAAQKCIDACKAGAP
jgi:hypothetical protein